MSSKFCQKFPSVYFSLTIRACRSKLQQWPATKPNGEKCNDRRNQTEEGAPRRSPQRSLRRHPGRAPRKAGPALPGARHESEVRGKARPGIVPGKRLTKFVKISLTLDRAGIILVVSRRDTTAPRTLERTMKTKTNKQTQTTKHLYYVSTDSGSHAEPFEFDSLAEALDDFGCPAIVP